MTACTLSVLVAFTACGPNQTPDQIRKQAAQDTATIKQDTKAVAEGIKQGLADKKSVDLNKASRDDLTNLPGITGERADRIIAARPFATTHELVTRHVISEDEYARIRDQITVGQ